MDPREQYDPVREQREENDDPTADRGIDPGEIRNAGTTQVVPGADEPVDTESGSETTEA